MFTRKKEPSLLDREIDRAIRDLRHHAINSEEYKTILNMVTSLHQMKMEETSKPVSKDTMAVIGGNLLGIVMILKHEWLHPIRTTAMNLILKPRVK